MARMLLLVEEEALAWRNCLAVILREFCLTSETGILLDIFETDSVVELAEALLELPLLPAGLLEAYYDDPFPFYNWEELLAEANTTPPAVSA